ncbi:MAG TPA: hypothetical protein VF529_15265 [Solirubrobacteraceae bacterium]|jgi:hypothetical protein
MRHGWLAALASMLLLLVAAPASAEHDRFVPAGLNSTVTSANFVVHYDPYTATAAAAQALSADMEESHSRLVAGAGSTPNAGLNTPIDDSDNRTDVYMSAPSNFPDFTGGIVYKDTHGAGASYIFMTPGLSRTGTRFRSAHEYMHVIQDAYFSGAGLLTESTANWASEWALPDIDPQDSNFSHPELPLDCSYGDFGGTPCGNGYRQWPFFWRLTQLYGGDVMDGLLDRMAAVCGAGCAPSDDRQILADEVAAQSGGQDTLSEVYADYARRIWVPAWWQSPAVSQFPTTAMQAIHNLMGVPDHRLYDQQLPSGDTGVVDEPVDHLAASYVLVRTDGGFEPTGPDDLLRIMIDRPSGLSQPFHSIVFTAAGAQDGPQVAVEAPETFDVSADPATTRQLLLPLVNDSPTANDLHFNYRVRFIRGTPTPPANDTPAGAITVPLNGDATTNNVYAGGRGNVTEATGCGPAQDATRGVWFRFTTDNDGLHSYNANFSDFGAIVALYRANDGSFAGCSGTGVFSGFQPGGTTYDVYVGRSAFETRFGTQAKLAVNGPGPVLPEVNVNTPQNGAVLGTRTPFFSGNASNRFGDSGSVRVLVWAGADMGAPPVRTFTAPRTNTSWGVVGPELPDGVYTWRAELDGKAGTGQTAPYTFTVRGPVGTGPGTGQLEPPIGDGTPPVSTECRRARTARTAARRKLASAKRALKKARGARRKRAARTRVARARRGLRRANVRVRRFCV